ncbi:MAG: hypothetical protein KDD45_01115 [Bdellovibrionales bacterium]|nr:hypothetical protein [Bdellovibrionales bacterium]
MRLIVIFLFAIILNGCVTPPGAMIKESNISLSETRKAVVKLFGEPRGMSQNGRELYTDYMDQKGRVLPNMKKAKERRFAHVTILGERRPYDIVLDVIIETQVRPDKYQAVDHDELLADVLAKDLRKELLKSRENRNMFDDFNAF